MKLKLAEKSHVLREKGGRKSASGGDRVIKWVSPEKVKRVGTSFICMCDRKEKTLM